MSTALVALSNKLASKLDIGEDGAELMATLKATAFKGPVTDAQMTALLIVANQYGLNPWTKEIYAFPDKNNGIVPVVGVDGWSRIINDHPQFDGMEFNQCPESCTCIIYRKDRARPTAVTEYLSECVRSTAPWQSHPRRMLRHKATIQCARMAFGFTGIFEQDEAERIVYGERVNNQSAAPLAIAEKAQQPPIDTPDRAQLVARLESVASKGSMSELSEAWQDIGPAGRKTIGGEEWHRIKDIAERAAFDAELTGAPSDE